MKQLKNILLIILVAGLLPRLSFAGRVKEVIVIHHPEVAKKEKEAILILPGLGDSKKRRKNQLEFFGQLDYDLFIPNFFDKNSVDACVQNFSDFYQENHLSEYKKIHVFSYILGSWVINKFILKNGKLNIATIVYDRSPLQERAPIILVENIPLIARMVKGKIVKDISSIPYPSISETGISIGIIVESKATKLIKHFKKKTLQKGKINWQQYDFKQTSADLIYTELNHDEMYIHFEIIGADILSFIKKGHFLQNSQRTWFNWDPFVKREKNQ